VGYLALSLSLSLYIYISISIYTIYTDLLYYLFIYIIYIRFFLSLHLSLSLDIYIYIYIGTPAPDSQDTPAVCERGASLTLGLILVVLLCPLDGLWAIDRSCYKHGHCHKGFNYFWLLLFAAGWFFIAVCLGFDWGLGNRTAMTVCWLLGNMLEKPGKWHIQRHNEWMLVWCWFSVMLV